MIRDTSFKLKSSGVQGSATGRRHFAPGDPPWRSSQEGRRKDEERSKTRARTTFWPFANTSTFSCVPDLASGSLLSPMLALAVSLTQGSYKSCFVPWWCGGCPGVDVSQVDLTCPGFQLFRSWLLSECPVAGERAWGCTGDWFHRLYRHVTAHGLALEAVCP